MNSIRHVEDIAFHINMSFDPKTNIFPYPIITDNHYIIVRKNNGKIFDEHYNYVDRSFWFKFKQFISRLVIVPIVFPLTRIRIGLKIEGKENLKKNKKLIKKGVISISNHIHMWDYLCIMNAIKPIRPHILAWQRNLTGESASLVRLVGGIPIPENNMKASVAFMMHTTKMLNDGGWLHIMLEGSMWEYYRPIRPFKRGAAYYAIKADKPIIPFAFSYREPSKFRKKVFKQIALLTLHIGEPIYVNKNLKGVEKEIDLTKRMHEAVAKLAGLSKEEDIYEPIFNNSRRIDYYTDTYGIGYKGSK